MAGSLPLALGRLGVHVQVVMPRYRGILPRKKKLSERISIYFVENEDYYNRASLYGTGDGDYPDNLKRFAFLCQSALEMAKSSGFKPDVVHAHEWQTALLPVFLKTKFVKDPFFEKTRSVLTLHNAAYQGIFPQKQFSELGLTEVLFNPETFEFYGKLN